MHRTTEVIVFIAVASLAALVVHGSLAARDEQLRLRATLAAQKQLLDAADARERLRDSTLSATLSQIAQLKHATQTPEQIVRGLSQYISLPQPITTGQAAQTPSVVAPGTGAKTASPMQKTEPKTQKGNTKPEEAPSQRRKSPDTTFPPSAAAYQSSGEIPGADLKPLYNYVLDCRACQQQLAAANQNTADDDAKIAALTRERDAGLSAAKGGKLSQAPAT